MNKKNYLESRNEIKKSLLYFIDGANIEFEFFKEFNNKFDRHIIFEDEKLNELYIKLCGICDYLTYSQYYKGEDKVYFSASVSPEFGFIVETHYIFDDVAYIIDRFWQRAGVKNACKD